MAAEKDVYLGETLDLLAAVREDRPTMVPIEEGVRSLNLALAAVRSDELGVPFERLRPLLKTGGFIPHTDHRVPPDVSLQNYLYYRQRKREFIRKA